MAGRLRFPFRQQTATAVLDEDGRWRCDEVPSLVRVLDALYSPRRDGTNPDGRAARRHLQDAALWLKGTIEPDPAAGRN